MKVDLDDYIEAHIDAEPAWLADLDRDTHCGLVNGRLSLIHI